MIHKVLSRDKSMADKSLCPHAFPNVSPFRSKEWRGFRADHYQLSALEIPEHLVTGHQFDVQLGPATKLCVRQDGHLMAGRFFRGHTIYTPPGTRCGGNWNEPRDVLILTLDNDFLVAALQDSIRGNGPEIAAQFNLHDPLIEQLAFALGTQLEAGLGERDDLYAESLANMLAAHLVKRYSMRDQPICEYQGGLPERKLRRVVEYINDNLAERLLLVDIAASVGCSPCHLERLFKPATGVALHKYVMQQRVERAKQLLVGTQKPIAEVALDCGFQDQSHFTKVFHRLIGVTPKTYRDLH